MMRNVACLSIVLACALSFMNSAMAAVPNEINFQGLLLDSGGSVFNGSVSLDFEIFDAVTAGNSFRRSRPRGQCGCCGQSTARRARGHLRGLSLRRRLAGKR